MKACVTCRVEMPVADFAPDLRNRDGRKGQCQPCINVGRRRVRNRSMALHGRDEKALRQRRHYHLVHQYGISLETYDAMVWVRDNRCDCCGSRPTARTLGGKLRDLAVDHCHDTGLIRGLLCTNCNAGIGLLGDTIDSLLAGITYMSSAPKLARL